MKLNEFFEELQQEYHINLNTTAYSVASIFVNNKWTVFFKELESPVFIIYTNLCPLSANQKEAFYEEILKVNLYGTQTDGIAFGLDEKNQMIVQYYRFEQEPASYKEVSNKLKKFIGVAERYKQIFEKF